MSTPLEVFCCYAREDQKMLAHLRKHLVPLERRSLIKIWSDADLNAGVEWEKELHGHLESADIILLLISPSFMSSDYCYSIEMRRAIERHDQESARVIPILLHPIIWRDTPFAKLQIVPRDTRPVAIWSNRDEAFNSVAESINQVVLGLLIQHPLIKADRSVGTAKLALPFRANVSTQTVERRRGPSKGTMILLVGLAFLVVVGGSVGIFSITRRNQQNPYPPFGTLVLADTLANNKSVHKWDDFPPDSLGGACQFIEGAYHSRADIGYLTACLFLEHDFSNSAFEVQMRIIKGDCGGLFFRSSPRSKNWREWTFYSFEVCQDGIYRLRNGFQDADKLISDHFSAEIHTGLNQSNVIAVVANNNMLDLYVNNHMVNSWSDSSHSQGKIGVEARTIANPTEVEFSDAKVWTSNG